MTKRNRIFIGILLIFAAGIAFMLYRVLADLDPRYRESAEESLVETAQLHGQPGGAGRARRRHRHGAAGAPVQVGLRPQLRGADLQRHQAPGRDAPVRHRPQRPGAVRLAGPRRRARTSRSGATSSWRCAANTAPAPRRTWRTIRAPRSCTRARRCAGTTTSSARSRWASRCKASASSSRRRAARPRTWAWCRSRAWWCWPLIVSVWLVRPFGLIADYVRYVRAQRRFSLPRLGRRAWGVIGAAYDEMRDALAGRNYVADYVQTLTHEVKSPLSAIRGAAELLQEPGMPQDQRQRFLANITRETQRIQEMVDRMMELTALETRRVAGACGGRRACGPCCEELAAGAQDAAAPRQHPHHAATRRRTPRWRAIRSCCGAPSATCWTTRSIFPPTAARCGSSWSARARAARIRVRDQGPGIPEYAQDKVFEKFYSLARPHSSKKSTGLGLAFVREIAVAAPRPHRPGQRARRRRRGHALAAAGRHLTHGTAGTPPATRRLTSRRLHKTPAALQTGFARVADASLRALSHCALERTPCSPHLSPARGLARWLWITGASVAAACFVTLAPGPAQAQADTPPRLKTESPYFFVKSDDPALDQLPLKSTRVDVRISGVIADVTVTQRYKNEGQRAIEAKYVFPGSTRAAVYGMNVRLGDRLITAQDPREAAGPHRIRQREEGGQDRRAAGAAPAQRVPDERRQHHARRRRAGGAALHRAAGAAGRQLPVRLSHRGRPALQQPAVEPGHGAMGRASRSCPPARRAAPRSTSRWRSPARSA